MAELFQQPKITGYRQLNDAEAALMNAIKAKGNELAVLVRELERYLAEQKVRAVGREVERIEQAQPGKWLAVGKTDLQVGLMALTRAVAQPGAF